MTVKTGSAWAGSFVTLDATGALSASADAAGVLYVDGVANAATVTITGSNPYKWSVTLPSLTAGQRVDMYITGTIATIATAGFVASEQADTALVSEVKTDTAAILADTGTDGVVLKAAGLNADAVAEIQSGLALESTLTAIKGAGWDTQTLAAIDVLIDAIKAKTDVIPASPAAAGEYTAAIAAIPTAPLLAANYTAPDNAGIAAIQAKTDLIPASPASAGEYTAAIAAIQADLDNPDQYKADVSAITGASLSAAGVDAILDEAVVGSYTMRQLLKVMAAALAGKATGGGTTSVTFRGVDDASDVIVATVDANGNRSAVTLTV